MINLTALSRRSLRNLLVAGSLLMVAALHIVGPSLDDLLSADSAIEHGKNISQDTRGIFNDPTVDAVAFASWPTRKSASSTFSGERRVQKGASGAPATASTESSDVINVSDVGLSVAFSAASAGKKIFVPSGTWNWDGASQLIVPDGSSVEFAGRAAIIRYTGDGVALLIKNSKNITLWRPNIDITNAGSRAEALHIAGCWWCDIYDSRMMLNGSSQTGIGIETSLNAEHGWGSYLINVFNPEIFGTGLFGIHTFQTMGDTGRSVTNSAIYGGWAKGMTYGLYLRQTSSFRVYGWVSDTGKDGINADDSDNLVLSPGEIGPNSGYAINLGSKLSKVSLMNPSQAGAGNLLGYINMDQYQPSVGIYDGNISLSTSVNNNIYVAKMGMLPAYNTSSFYIDVLGGSKFSKATRVLSFVQGEPSGAGMTQVGDSGASGRKSDTVLGRADMSAADGSGFVQIPAASGAPSGRPAIASGHAPIYVDAAGEKLCIYVNSSWKCTRLE